jgi:replicative DNA helicase
MAIATAQVEQALVGSLMISPDRIIKIADVVRPTDFADTRAQMAYTSILGEYSSKRPADLVSIAAKHPALAGWLSEATGSACPPAVGSYATEIANSARLRRIRTGIEAAAMESEADIILSRVMGLYQHEMRAGHKAPEITDVLRRFYDVVRENRKKGRVGFSTGFNVFERQYIRYQPGHIWTIGGYTSVGKTAFMVQQIVNLLVSGENPSILIISTEMTEEQIVARIVANITGVHSFRILTGNYREAWEEETVTAAMDSLGKARLTIYDDVYRLDDIETAFRKADLQGGVDVGWIDYVQNCRWPEAKSQYQEQAEMAKRLQSLAKEVRATLVCLSQVSNDVGRGNTDQLELKGAGEWAAVSDVGIMLKRNKTEKHRLKVEIKKNRHGALGEAEFEYVNEYTSLHEKF